MSVCEVVTRSQLIEELDALIKESTDPKQIHIYQEGLIHLQDLIQSKVNLTCEDIFKVKKRKKQNKIKAAEFGFRVCFFITEGQPKRRHQDRKL